VLGEQGRSDAQVYSETFYTEESRGAGRNQHRLSRVPTSLTRPHELVGGGSLWGAGAARRHAHHTRTAPRPGMPAGLSARLLVDIRAANATNAIAVLFDRRNT
jgi:hypothetical protein